MSESKTIVAEAQRWLIYAERDLQAAQLLLNQGNNFSQQVCFLSQQAVEKGLKAGLIFLQVEFPFRHDLDLLRNLLPEDWRCCLECPNLAQLTQWAVEVRYPSLSEEPSSEDAQIAAQQAQQVLATIKQDLIFRMDSLL
jgi:HEPN domain-containing protein